MKNQTFELSLPLPDCLCHEGVAQHAYDARGTACRPLRGTACKIIATQPSQPQLSDSAATACRSASEIRFRILFVKRPWGLGSTRLSGAGKPPEETGTERSNQDIAEPQSEACLPDCISRIKKNTSSELYHVPAERRCIMRSCEGAGSQNNCSSHGVQPAEFRHTRTHHRRARKVLLDPWTQ